VTETLQQEHELRRSREQLRELAAYINGVREEERARIALELHDVLGGILTSIKMDATRIRRRATSEELNEITGGLIDLTQEAIDAVRQMSEVLHPTVIEHLGLPAAISLQLRQFSARYGIAAAFTAPDPALPLTQKQSIAVYRICQEALTNIARHAQASNIEVMLGIDAGHMLLTASDNGCGIDFTKVKGGSIGMFSMAERAREIGGGLEIQKQASGGTRLSLSVPLREGESRP
jgi:signal transduction histidine kinase